MVSIDEFHQTLSDYYSQNKRSLPWRNPEPDGTFDSYKVMVSEIMLQQTQVPRVIEKYASFLEVFPTIQSLAAADLSDVLRMWQGLGYNRRARFLRETARVAVNEYSGFLPRTVNELVTMPGIGHNTASAILAYSYNQPLVFIETNIRSVYLHHFFKNREAMSDKEILELVAQTIDQENPREFYWALMDYGTYIKKIFGNPNVRSKQYTKQSAFIGSSRQIRGEVLRQLAAGPRTLEDMQAAITDARLEPVLTGLIRDNLVVKRDEVFLIAS